MFGIEFSEFLVIGVVALIVLGPERLPKVARTVGHLLGRFQRYASDVKDQVKREMEAEDLKKLEAQFLEARDSATQMGNSIQQEVTRTESEVKQAMDPNASSLEFAEPSATPAAEPAPASEPSTPSPQLELPLPNASTADQQK